MVDIDKLRNGEVNEFKKLTLMLSVKVLNLAYHLTGNKEDAEDITQEVFLAVFNGLPNFKGASEQLAHFFKQYKKINKWLVTN